MKTRYVSIRLKNLFVISLFMLLFFLFGVPNSNAATASGYVWPLEGYQMTQSYKYYNNPNTAHEGIDIAAPKGTTVKAVKDGTVVCASTASASAGTCANCGFWDAGYHVVIRQIDGYFAMYAHLSKVSVTNGSSVSAGEKVGEVGSTGNSEGNHLHFSMYRNSNGYIQYNDTVNPLSYLTPFSSVYIDSFTDTSATIWGIFGAKSFPFSEGGIYMGTSPDDMKKITDAEMQDNYDEFSNGITHLYFNTSKYYGQLTKGTTYYYQIWVKHNGTEFKSDLYRFVAGDPKSGELVHKQNHSYIYQLTKKPTISSTGILIGSCSKCNGKTAVTLPKLNTTDYDYSATKAATCTVAGSGRYTWKITTYGSFYFDVSIPATGHKYTSKVTAPTCTEDGYATHTCSACGDSYKDSITEALGHDYKNGTCIHCGAKDPNSPVANYDVTFTLGSVSGAPGETITVELAVDSKVAWNSMGITSINYDPAVLTFVGFENYDALNQKAFMCSFDESNGTIVIALNPAEQYSGKVCDLVFTINEDAEEGISTTIGAESLVKLSSKEIASTVKSAEIQVFSQVLGDIDGNEFVDLDDCLALFQYSMFPDIYPVEYTGNMDYDHNGVVDLDDCLALFQYSMFPDIYPIS